MFVCNYYVRISADRLRVDTAKIWPGFDDLAVVAVRSDRKGSKIIAAIGREAEKLTGQSDIEIVRPFAHPRTPIHNFLIASKLLQKAVRELWKKRSWSDMAIIARVIVHPLHQVQEGLTDVEERALAELATNAGARTVAIHTGRELLQGEIDTFDFSGANNRFQRTQNAFGVSRR